MQPMTGKIGRERALAFGKVEGMTLSRKMQGAFQSFDTQGLTPAQRREQIRAEFTKKR